MADTQLERVEFRVPIDSGHLIGNTLRQFAMRGVSTWQAAAYMLASKDGTFGLGEGYPFSYTVFLNGRLISKDVDTTVTEKLCTFELSGDDYVCGDMVIKNLGKLGAPRLDVCLVYAKGSRSQAQNYDVAKRLCPRDVDSFVAVPSKHTRAIKFGYDVVPFDRGSETLIIEATAGVIAMARDSAVKSLSGLHI